MNLYVSNLNYNLDDNGLKDFFTPYGEVSSAKVVMDRGTGRSKGFGFVEMSDEAAAKKAISELNDTSVDGRKIGVAEARPREDRPSRGNGGGGFRDNRR